jgi:hypothetical protein
VGAIFDGAHARVHALASRLAAAFRDPTEWIPGWPERVESDEPGYDEDRARLPLMLPFTLTLIAFGVIAGWRFLG